MTRATYVLRDGKLVEKHLAAPLPAAGERHGAGPMLIIDCYSANPVRSIVDGRPIASRAELREHNKRNGVVDVGNDPAFLEPRQPNVEPQGVEMDVKRAMHECGVEY